MTFENKNVLVVGTGISGIAAVKLLSEKGANIVLLEGNDKLTASEIENKYDADLNIKLIIGELPEECMETLNLAVLSPGVPIDIPMVNAIREKGIQIIGEVELAYECARGQLLAITGTNGKTTTTALVGEIMKAAKESVFVVGNIGMPYTGYALETTEDSVTVAEISSFQLETIQDFKPDVSAVLNISPDHLNRHYTMENYIRTKMDIAKNQGADECCVLNYEDEELRRQAEMLSVPVVYFSSRRELEQGVYLKGDTIYYRDGDTQEVCKTSELHLLGTHNYENVMAAVAITRKAGVPMDVIRDAVKKFVAVEHRIEYVTEKNGVKYYNDSKGTNPDAAIKAIEAMVRPTVLIGGGYDKDATFDAWIDAFEGKVKSLILMGATKEKIAKACENKFDKITFVESLQEAVETASQQAQPGDAVLLSPACASWDMFTSYEQRGALFKEYVNAL